MSPPGDRREPLADTKCPPAAQRKQARSALVCIYVRIYIYICYELIGETARPRKLIFACGSLLAMAPVSSELRAKYRLIMEL